MRRTTRRTRRSRLRRLLAMYGNACFWCGAEMLAGPRNDPLNMTLDELVPQYRGGVRALFNQVAAHKRCNGRRGSVIAPAAAIARHHDMLRQHGMLPDYVGHPLTLMSGGKIMPEMKTTHAQDNPDHEAKEAERQKQRDEAVAQDEKPAEEKAKAADKTG